MNAFFCKLRLPLALIALLLLCALLLAGCDKKDDKPVDTTPESTPTTTEKSTTPAVTEPETKPDGGPVLPEGDALTDAADYLDRLLAKEDETSAAANAKTVMDLTVDLHMVMGKQEQELSMPMCMTEITANGATHILSNTMGETYELIYVDGMLYADCYGELLKCPATPEQFAEAADVLAGSDGEDDGADITDLLSGMHASEVFGSIIGVTCADGTAAVLAKGFNKAAVDKLAPDMMEFLFSLGMVGGDLTEEDYESKTEEELDALLVAETARVLRDMSEDALTMLFTVDREGRLCGVDFRLSLSSTVRMEEETVKTDLVLRGDATHTEGGQSVKAPANAKDYEEGTWQDYFGDPLPEEVGLIPDERGVYTLSTDPETRSEQTWCIYCSPELFEDAPFRVRGMVELLERADDGSTVLTIYTRAADGTWDYESTVDAMFAEGMTEKLIPTITDGKVYELDGTFEILELEGYEFIVFVVSAVTPVAVGV